MIVDSTLLNSEKGYEGIAGIEEGGHPIVLQLGGNDP
jgi:hypothetical protein